MTITIIARLRAPGRQAVVDLLPWPLPTPLRLVEGDPGAGWHLVWTPPAVVPTGTRAPAPGEDTAPLVLRRIRSGGAWTDQVVTDRCPSWHADILLLGAGAAAAAAAIQAAVAAAPGVDWMEPATPYHEIRVA